MHTQSPIPLLTLKYVTARTEFNRKNMQIRTVTMIYILCG